MIIADTPVRIGACAILVRDGRVLLGHRSPTLSYYPNVWDLIGGHLQAGETPAQAMVRETWEEVGCRPTQYYHFDVVTEPSPDVHGPGEFHIFVVTHWDGAEPQPKNHEHDQIAWFSLKEIPQLSLADKAYLNLLARVKELND